VEKNFVLNLREPTRESIKSEKNFLKCSSQMIDDVIASVEQVLYIYIYIHTHIYIDNPKFYVFLENLKSAIRWFRVFENLKPTNHHRFKAFENLIPTNHHQFRFFENLKSTNHHYSLGFLKI